MTNFENIKNKNVDDLAIWIDKYVNFDGSQHMDWFNDKYCNNCPSIMCHYSNSDREFPCSWCELNDNKCKYFLNMDETPDNREIIKMWLEEEE